MLFFCSAAKLKCSNVHILILFIGHFQYYIVRTLRSGGGGMVLAIISVKLNNILVTRQDNEVRTDLVKVHA
uniref:Uncharacterized protein n=1 Tax=Poecilia reticulata TaxID=8081 RepID=A0A3P9P7U8_POERE